MNGYTIDRKWMKRDAKEAMRHHRPSIYLIAFVFLLITAVLEALETRLQFPGVRVQDLMYIGDDLEAAQRFISALSGCAPVEFIRRFRASDASSGTAEKRLLELLKRGPLPREAVGRELDLSDFETDLLLKKLAFSGSIRLGQTDGVPCVALGK